ncbi:hypothetical protein B0T10DRAFT_579694 [Thelonectria olida]|uniref:Uncharacterized protein n=1 Tax=Thelonectria olida TaxID=1576542 RepID=A0A9P8W084_9HYPO|nr:hypothetical protein B0T10DRAFT_579694 [Thelonectria olida]
MPLVAWKNRTVVGASFMAMLTLMSNLFAAVFVPVPYEASRGVTSLKAGLLVVPFLLTVVLSQAAEGLVMAITKRYWHCGWTCPAFLAIGGGLLYTVDANTSDAALISFTQNVAFLPVQADNDEWAVPFAIAIVSSSCLMAYVDQSLAMQCFRVDLSGDVRDNVIKGYIRALNDIYIGAVLIAGILIACGLLIRNKSLAGKVTLVRNFGHWQVETANGFICMSL